MSAITDQAANALAPVIGLCQIATDPNSQIDHAPGKNVGMKAALTELANYLQAQATALTNQAAGM